MVMSVGVLEWMLYGHKGMTVRSSPHVYWYSNNPSFLQLSDSELFHLRENLLATSYLPWLLPRPWFGEAHYPVQRTGRHNRPDVPHVCHGDCGGERWGGWRRWRWWQTHPPWWTGPMSLQTCRELCLSYFSCPCLPGSWSDYGWHPLLLSSVPL